MAAAPQNADFRSASAAVRNGMQAGDVIVYYPGWNQKPMEYYLGAGRPAIYDIPVPVSREQILQAIAPGLPGYQRAWLVWSIGHYGDPEGNIEAYFDANYHRVSYQEFVGPVGVALYDLEAAP
jgi:hypothetical protein